MRVTQQPPPGKRRAVEIHSTSRNKTADLPTIVHGGGVSPFTRYSQTGVATVTLASFVRDAAESALETVFPPRCVGCEDLLDAPRRLACPRCAPTVERVESPRCPTCALPRPQHVGFETAGVDERCRHCRDDPPDQDATRSHWLYRGAVADALQRAKYGQDLWRLRTLADAMTPWMSERIEAFATEATRLSPGIVPVPMHPIDLRERGFNAAALLLRRSLRGTAHEVDWDVLEKAERTPPQAGLTRGERLSNVEGVFEPRASELERPDWIVFDDIMTTGATASEVAKTLREAGAERILVLTAARALWNS